MTSMQSAPPTSPSRGGRNRAAVSGGGNNLVRQCSPLPKTGDAGFDPPSRGGLGDLDQRRPKSPKPVTAPSLVIIACGALARELRLITERNALAGIKLACLPAHLHNRPQLIPDAVRRKIAALRPLGGTIFCAYADCGTGGELDRVLAEEGVERLPGAHCYAFYAGLEAFDALHDEEPGTFYLTDFLARHFDRLIVEGAGPRPRIPSCSTTISATTAASSISPRRRRRRLLARAQRAAEFLKLPLVVRESGFGLLESEVLARAE